jgi:MOSC domain-containing protein YiiM
MGIVDQLFVTDHGGRPMVAVGEVEAVPGCGLRGDRYCEGTGFYVPYDVCQVTMIAVEDLESAAEMFGVVVGEGEHRRNIVTRGLDLPALRGRSLTIGEVRLSYERPRPPCGYIQKLTGQKQFTKALGGRWGSPRGGICLTVDSGGAIRVGDPIEVLGERLPPLRSLP